MDTNNLDGKYTDLLQDILDNGNKKGDRTGTGTISVFGREIRHDMSEGFPLLTTKKMAWKSMVVELIWFLKGDTNIKYLVENGCNIWNGDAYKKYITEMQRGKHGYWYEMDEFIQEIKTNDEFAKKWGDLGPIYGAQWRGWKVTTNDEQGPTYENTEIFIDQLLILINQLNQNPDSRRLIVNAWNVGEIDDMTLPPCHLMYQLYTRELTEKERWNWLRTKYWTTPFNPAWDRMAIPPHEWLNEASVHNVKTNEYLDVTIPKRAISLKWTQRSVDTFLGLPFNIASYGLLLQIIAQHVNMVPEELIGGLGDTHLYLNHIDQAKEQVTRMGMKLPTVTIKPFDSIEGLTFEHFELNDYKSHGRIKAPLSN